MERGRVDRGKDVLLNTDVRGQWLERGAVRCQSKKVMARRNKGVDGLQEERDDHRDFDYSHSHGSARVRPISGSESTACNDEAVYEPKTSSPLRRR